MGIAARIQQWVVSRNPPVTTIELSHRNIYVLPTRWGMAFIGVIVLLLLTGINYQNSMILAAGFFLIAIGILQILLSFRNLVGLTISFHHAEPCFAGDMGGFEFLLLSRTNGSRQGCHYSIEFGWPPDNYAVTHVEEERETRVFVERLCPSRGVMNPGRLLITTTYPMGLIRAWSWQDLKAEIIVYPVPIEGGDVWGARNAETKGEPKPLRSQTGADEFEGLRNYVPGESLQRVAWKKYAQTGEFYSKDFREPSADPEWLEYKERDGRDQELQLSHLCFQVCQLTKRRKSFGLRLPQLAIPPATGEFHQRQCLEALARYPNHSSKKHS